MRSIMISRKKVIIIIVAIVLCIASLTAFYYRNRIRHYDEFKKCKEIVKIIDKYDDPVMQIKLKDIDFSDNVLTIHCTYVRPIAVSKKQMMSAFIDLRAQINDYLMNDEGFYYSNKAIKLHFDDNNKGNDDLVYHMFNFTNYIIDQGGGVSEIISPTLDVLYPLAGTPTDAVGEMYGMKYVGGEGLYLTTLDFFEVNPQLIYCKVYSDDPKEDKEKIQDVCTECEIDIR